MLPVSVPSVTWRTLRVVVVFCGRGNSGGGCKADSTDGLAQQIKRERRGGAKDGCGQDTSEKAQLVGCGCGIGEWKSLNVELSGISQNLRILRKWGQCLGNSQKTSHSSVREIRVM